jgi:transcriptional regulator with PAS, ATPase and Fis domain
MSIDLDETDDGESSRPHTPSAPTLLLLYTGGLPLREPRRIAISTGSLVIGRAAESDAGLALDDKRASRIHAVVKRETNGQLAISDAGSRNGTFVNGDQVRQAGLRDGDIVRIGDSLLIVRFSAGSLEDSPCSYLIGCSSSAVQLRQMLSRLAATRTSILLLGETGTGKEVAARYLHEHSGRSGPLITVNCGALPESLVESLLFGHTRGAFTGATQQTGFFRTAQNGSLLFDEIGELPLAVQPKLLRVLEDRMVYPVGATTGQAVDVRLMFATNRKLLEAVSLGNFRADLYARIAEVLIDLPPLRSRREDILMLLRHALPEGAPLPLPASLAEVLLLHNWPFNIREVVKLAAELSATSDPETIAARLRRPASPPPATESEPSSEDRMLNRERLATLLNIHRGNVAAIARELKCPRKYIYRWVEQYNLDLNAYRD